MEREFNPLSLLKEQLLNERLKDKLLAFVIATIGGLGSYVILKENILSPEQTGSYNLISNSTSQHEDEETYGVINHLGLSKLGIEGEAVIGSKLRIHLPNYDPNKKYKMDFGNGIESILQESKINILYNSPGIYNIKCFELMNNQWKLVGAHKITIHLKNTQGVSVL